MEYNHWYGYKELIATVRLFKLISIKEHYYK